MAAAIHRMHLASRQRLDASTGRNNPSTLSLALKLAGLTDALFLFSVFFFFFFFSLLAFVLASMLGRRYGDANRKGAKTRH